MSFAAASLVCGLAPNLTALIGARIAQGIGGAMLTPGSLAIIEASFVRDDRGKAIGAWAGLGGISTAIGPLLGGYLTQAFSWRLIFLLNLPLAAAVIWIAMRHVQESADPEATQLDLPGAALAVVGLGGTTYALIEAPNRGLESPVIVGSAVIGVLALIAFVLVEARAPQPMLPLSLFRSRPLVRSTYPPESQAGTLGQCPLRPTVFLFQRFSSRMKSSLSSASGFRCGVIS